MKITALQLGKIHSATCGLEELTRAVAGESRAESRLFMTGNRLAKIILEMCHEVEETAGADELYATGDDVDEYCDSLSGVEIRRLELREYGQELFRDGIKINSILRMLLGHFSLKHKDLAAHLGVEPSTLSKYLAKGTCGRAIYKGLSKLLDRNIQD